MPSTPHERDEITKRVAGSESELPGNPPTKRVNFNLPESAVAEATAAARQKGWNLTQFFLFALAVAVRVLEETASGGQILLKSGKGEVRELLIPKW